MNNPQNTDCIHTRDLYEHPVQSPPKETQGPERFVFLSNPFLLRDPAATIPPQQLGLQSSVIPRNQATPICGFCADPATTAPFPSLLVDWAALKFRDSVFEP